MQRTQAACRPDLAGTPPSASSPSSDAAAPAGHVCPPDAPVVTRRSHDRDDAPRTNGVTPTQAARSRVACSGVGVLQVASDPELDTFFQASLAQAAPSLAARTVDLGAPPGKGMRAYVQQTWAEWLGGGRQHFTEAADCGAGPNSGDTSQSDRAERSGDAEQRGMRPEEAGPSGRAAAVRHALDAATPAADTPGASAWAEGGRSVRARVHSDPRGRQASAFGSPSPVSGAAAASGEVELRGSAWADLVSMQAGNASDDGQAGAASEVGHDGTAATGAHSAASLGGAGGSTAAPCAEAPVLPQGPVIRGGAGFAAFVSPTLDVVPSGTDFGPFMPPNLDAGSSEQQRDAGERAHWLGVSDPDAMMDIPQPVLAQQMGFADTAQLQSAQHAALAALQQRANQLASDDVRWRQETEERELAGWPATTRQRLADAAEAVAAEAAAEQEQRPPARPARGSGGGGGGSATGAPVSQGSASAVEVAADPAAAFRVSPPPSAHAAPAQGAARARSPQADGAAVENRAAGPQQPAASGEDELVGAIAQDLFGGRFENDSDDDGQSDRDEAELCSYLYGQVCAAPID